MMFPTSNAVVITELQKIAADNDGHLRRPDVEFAARPISSPLHKFFEWDEEKGAYKYRLVQAGHLIAAVVRWVQLNGDRRPVRVFVSLKTDRLNKLGYIETVNALTHKNTREQMLLDAMEDLRRFELKYGTLKELAEVMAASKKARNKLIQLMAA